MSNFLKLSTMIINTNHIKQIQIYKSQYNILLENTINGIMIYGSGGIYTKPNEIIVNEKTMPNDYELVSNWLKKLD